jgi:hypothetical protein
MKILYWVLLVTAIALFATTFFSHVGILIVPGMACLIGAIVIDPNRSLTSRFWRKTDDR